jgi:hypothetical protein
VYRLQIFKLFTTLHASGFAHHDVDGRNIMKNQDGKFILVDLEHSRPHKCEVRLQVLIGDFAPPESDFGCDELYNLAIELDFWLPGMHTMSYGRHAHFKPIYLENLNFYGYHVPFWAFKNGEAKNLVDMLPSYTFRTEEDRQKALQCAEKMIEVVQDVQAEYANVPDEQRYLLASDIPKSRSSSKPTLV